ncbi:site-specific integrase [Pedobacter miscanthi]|uniref:site-specific integrase n=1 Tax=Pedobacter miscanthi TaxID=2259170 RepID=UPI002931AA64|nr:site-specific integrase [Pedobacter miscanthi]
MSKVTIRKRELKNYRHALFLDFYPPIRHPKTGALVRRENLKLFVYDKPKNDYHKKHNKETLNLAEHVRCTRQIDVQSRKFGFLCDDLRDGDFIAFFKEFSRKKQRSTSDGAAMGVRYFEAFAGETLKFSDLDEFFCEDYKHFLLGEPGISRRGRGISRNTAVSYFAKFRTVLKEIYKRKLINDDLYTMVEPIDAKETHRERLEIEELQLLVHTSAKSDVMRRACLFSSLTGLRFSDVQSLTWDEVRGYQGNYSLQYRQDKTDSAEILPISDQAVELMGRQRGYTDKVFEDLVYYRIKGFLRDWVKKAGIQKNITFHSFRHTYATLQIQMGTDLYTVSKMLGHKSIKTTEIYAKVVDSKKIEAAKRIKLEL